VDRAGARAAVGFAVGRGAVGAGRRRPEEFPIAFHVEIRHALRQARAFNLEPEELRRRILEPWSRGERVELGDRQWHPGDSEIRVLEGPRLDGADLAHGQGWHHAERSARDVTAAALRAVALDVPVAVRARSAEAGAAAAAVLERAGARGVDWEPIRTHLLGRRGASAPEHPIAAALIVVDADEHDGGWRLDAGLAIGAFGPRAVLAHVGAPPADPEPAAARLDAGDPASIDAVAARLREALTRDATPRSRA
jgi:hypothetical protein